MRHPIPGPEVPRPTAARLAFGSGARGLKVPFGLAAFGDGEGAAVVVSLRAHAGVADVAEQVPAGGSLREGTLVVVLEHAEREGSGVTRLFRPRTSVPVAVRCSALLARGYVRIGGGVDLASRQELAWGFAAGPVLF